MEIPTHFNKVRDFRVEGRCLHRLRDILGLVLCGTLADCDDFTEIADYGQDNLGFLQTALGYSFPSGIPSEDTLDRVLRYLSSEQLEESFKDSNSRFGSFLWQ